MKDWVFLASDTQATFGPFKTQHNAKIEIVRFACGNSCLLTFSDRFKGFRLMVDTFSELAAKKRWVSPFTARDTFEEAIAKARFKLWETRPKNAYTDKEMRDWRLGYGASLFLAYIHGGSPFFFKADLLGGPVISETADPFYADGSGQLVASHTLGSFNLAKLSRAEAVAVCVYSVAACVRSDPACGKPIHVAVIKGNYPVPETEIYPQDMIGRFSRVTEKVADEISRQLLQKISLRYSSAAKDFDLE